MEIELIVCSQYQTFDCIDLCLSIRRNLQIDFLEPYHRMLRFNNFSIQIRLVHSSEQYLNSEITKPSSKLNLIIPKTAFGTLKPNDHDIPKKGNLRE